MSEISTSSLSLSWSHSQVLMVECAFYKVIETCIRISSILPCTDVSHLVVLVLLTLGMHAQ